VAQSQTTLIKTTTTKVFFRRVEERDGHLRRAEQKRELAGVAGGRWKLWLFSFGEVIGSVFRPLE